MRRVPPKLIQITRMRCDKSATDPKQHAGPFKRVGESGDLVIATCQGCGNTIFRTKTAKEKRRVEKPNR